MDDNICIWLRPGGGQEHDIDKNRAEGDGSGDGLDHDIESWWKVWREGGSKS